MPKKLVYCLVYVESCGAETCPPTPSQATGDSVFLQLSRGMDLDSAHLVDLREAQSGICGFRTVYVDIILYFSSSNTISWNTSQMVYPQVLIDVIFSVD
jgi:hypothetical protein